MKKLLGIFAHPDDESIDAGGTIAKYAASGWRIDLVCATRGEAGGDADVRTKELEEAAALLGVYSVTFLDYKDGELSEKHPGEIEDALVSVLADIRPDIVITHEPNGLTNHADHIKLSCAATFAFQTYARQRYDQDPDDKNPSKLYFACFPQSVMSYLIAHTYFPKEMHGKPIQGIDDKRINTVIDIKRFSSQKVRAMDAHVTQREHLEKYVRVPHSPFFEQEFFILRYVGVTEVFMGKHDRVSDRL